MRDRIGRDGLPAGRLDWRSLVDWSYPNALLAALIVAVVVGLLVGASTTAATYGTFNGRWDGSAELRATAVDAGVEPHVLLETDGYRQFDADGTVAFVLSPETAYSATEGERLRAFVESGGTLVVAEDFRPHGNAVLRAVGADARVDGRPLRDAFRNSRTAAFPRATNVSDTSLTTGVDALTLNHPSAVDPGTATVLVRSSQFAYLDADDDGAIDETEPLTRYPVATVESVGAGRVVVVSDPSLFVNAMLDEEGNARFAEALLAGHDRVVLDQSHVAGQPPLAVALLWLRRVPALQVVVGLLAIGGVHYWRRERSCDTTLAQTAESAHTPTDGATLVSLVRERAQTRPSDDSQSRE